MALEVSYASRNIGDIFYTLRKDKTLNGAVTCDGQQYSASDFDLSDEAKNPYILCVNDLLPHVDYTTYDLEVKNNGCCAYFGIDPVTGTFRVPLIKDVYVRSGDAKTLAQYLKPAIPNITGKIGHVQFMGWWGQTGAFGHDDHSNLASAYKGNTTSPFCITFDAHKCSDVYTNDFNSVRPPSVILRPMVQLIVADGGYSSGGGSNPNDPDAPAMTLKIPYVFIPGTEAKATEVNTNFEYVLKAIQGADKLPVVHLANDETITGRKTFLSPITTQSIELQPGYNAAYGGSIDFHFGGSTLDYTARIAELTRGHLSLNQSPPEGDSSKLIATTEWVKKETALPTFYDNGTSHFILYPNGYIIQSGQITVSGNPATVRVDLIKEMRDMNYGISLSSEDISGTTVNGTEIGWGRLDTKGFYVGRNEGYTGTQRIRWTVTGYIKS